jgi:RNA polymerase sigma-70 factor, ECF subfamily
VTETSAPEPMIEHLFRRQVGRMVSHFTRLLGPSQLDFAEDAVQEAMLRALQTWPYQGVPENAAAWLFRAAHNVAIDAARRRKTLGDKKDQIVAELARSAAAAPGDPDIEEQLRDDELRMVVMCCHPALSRDSSVALGLKTVGGFSVREIARAFLADEAAVAQRLVRAKRQIRDERLSFDMPGGAELSERLIAVLEVLYFMFNEGYAAHSGEDLIRRDLCMEALRLARLVATSSIGTPRAHALAALMAFQAARLPARVDEAGELVLLESQDRSRWDRELIGLAFHHFDRSIAGGEVSEYHAQAAIAATHARAADAASIDWPAILLLYDQLLAINPSPVIELNRAVAIAKVHGPAEALAALEVLEGDPKLAGYYLFLAVRGHLLLDLGDPRQAAGCFRAALERPCSEPERRFLRRKIAECETPEIADRAATTGGGITASSAPSAPRQS